jgi:hypothetical protein
VMSVPSMVDSRLCIVRGFPPAPHREKVYVLADFNRFNRLNRFPSKKLLPCKALVNMPQIDICPYRHFVPTDILSAGCYVATITWHGKCLLLFFAQLCKSFETFNRSPGGGGGSKTLEWTASAQEAFQIAKRLLAAAVPLQHPAPNAELSLATDASDTHIVMQQKSGDPLSAILFPKTHRHGATLCSF